MCLSVVLLHYEQCRAVVGENHPLTRKLKSCPQLVNEDKLVGWSKILQAKYNLLCLPAENPMQLAFNNQLFGAMNNLNNKVTLFNYVDTMSIC